MSRACASSGVCVTPVSQLGAAKPTHTDCEFLLVAFHQTALSCVSVSYKTTELGLDPFDHGVLHDQDDPADQCLADTPQGVPLPTTRLRTHTHAQWAVFPSLALSLSAPSQSGLPPRHCCCCYLLLPRSLMSWPSCPPECMQVRWSANGLCLTSQAGKVTLKTCGTCDILQQVSASRMLLAHALFASCSLTSSVVCRDSGTTTQRQGSLRVVGNVSNLRQHRDVPPAHVPPHTFGQQAAATLHAAPSAAPRGRAAAWLASALVGGGIEM